MSRWTGGGEKKRGHDLYVHRRHAGWVVVSNNGEGERRASSMADAGFWMGLVGDSSNIA